MLPANYDPFFFWDSRGDPFREELDFPPERGLEPGDFRFVFGIPLLGAGPSVQEETLFFFSRGGSRGLLRRVFFFAWESPVKSRSFPLKWEIQMNLLLLRFLLEAGGKCF